MMMGQGLTFGETREHGARFKDMNNASRFMYSFVHETLQTKSGTNSEENAVIFRGGLVGIHPHHPFQKRVNPLSGYATCSSGSAS
jgi:hypothetical protein